MTPTPRQQAEEVARRVTHSRPPCDFGSTEAIMLFADTLESLYKRIEILEAMERQVMDLSHPNFKELQKRIEGLEEKNRELLEENAKLIDYSQKLEAKLEKTVEVLKSIVNEYETLEKLEKDEDHNRPASYVLPIKKGVYIVCKEVLKEIEDGK